MPFVDRRDAGRRLGGRLAPLAGHDVVVLGLPRGGVPVAFEVARELAAPLDVIVVRKLGVPYQPELAMGAIGEDGVLVANDDVVRRAHLTREEIRAVGSRERTELNRRLRRFRGDRPGLELAGRTVIVVDDGIATGSTARAACQVVRARHAGRVILAVPVAAADTLASLRADADEVICVETREHFGSVGQWYADFTQTTDEQVAALLARASAGEPPHRAHHEDVEIRVGGSTLAGRLTEPPSSSGLVLFAHGSGSGRHSPRNRFVSELLNQAGLATLLLDLLTPGEAGDRANVFDTALMAGRLAAAANQVRGRHARFGYFGASTGAAAALWSAAEPDSEVAAIVSRGGRPDLAWSRLDRVRAPTLLIVGDRDQRVLDLNRRARSRLRCPSELAVVPGASHVFEEPGTLRVVAELARDWFTTHFLAELAGQPH